MCVFLMGLNTDKYLFMFLFSVVVFYVLLICLLYESSKLIPYKYIDIYI